MMKPVLCSSIALADGLVPDWVHLLPAGSVRTKDGRGPYQVENSASLIALSMAGGKLLIDECHATDLAAPKGLPAPARGWIVELQQRSDGIWGRVEWTGTGRRLMSHREYDGLSPVIVHNKAGVVSAILRASLTNTPNLPGLTALNAQNGDRAAQLAQLRAGIRDLGTKVALHAQAKADNASIGLTTPRAVMQKARELQVELARMGLPIDLDSAVASIKDEEASARSDQTLTITVHSDAGRASAKRELIEALGLDRGVSDDILAAAAIKAAKGDHRSVAAIADELTPADKEVIKKLGLDPKAYLEHKSPPSPDPRLTPGDLDMIMRLGLDSTGYAKAKEQSDG